MQTKKQVRDNDAQSSLINALHDVRRGIPLRQACKMYGISKSTLYDKLKNKSKIDCTMGPSTILSPEEEKELLNWIFYTSERGFPVTKDQFLDSVQLLIGQLQRKNPFTNNRPGRHWYEAFVRRHPELSRRIAQNLTTIRASVTEDCLRKWFNEVCQYLLKKELLLIDASRYFNCDETSFLLCPKAEQVIVKKGAKSVYKIVNADEKKALTTLVMISASGVMAPPMIMYAYKRIPAIITQNIPKGWSIGTSDKGWMTAESFYEYVTNVFYPWLKTTNIVFPVVLFVDGHSSHLTLPLSNFCRQHEIELIALYPNATHILQPLDVAVFHPLKSAWKKTVNNWRLENNGQRLKKEMFAPLLKKAIDSIDVASMAKNGFQTCGLYPFTPDAVDFNVLNKQKKSEAKKTEKAEKTEEASKMDMMKHINFFEQQLPEGMIDKFKAAETAGVWNYEIENEGLFRYWLEINRKTGNSPDKI